jgi:hypothetical protein
MKTSLKQWFLLKSVSGILKSLILIVSWLLVPSTFLLIPSFLEKTFWAVVKSDSKIIILLLLPGFIPYV